MNERSSYRSNDSLAPIELDEVTLAELEADAAAMTGSPKRSLLFGLAIGMGTFVAVMFWMQAIDQSNAYGQAAATLHGIQVERIDAFWECAVPSGYPKARTDAALAASIAGWSGRNPTVYAHYVQSCMPHLTTAESRLATMRVPNDLFRQALDARNALSSVRLAWVNQLTMLADAQTRYDANASRAQALKIARAKSEAAHAMLTLKQALLERR